MSSSRLHIQLAEAVRLYDRLVAILPPDRWDRSERLKVLSELSPPLRRELAQISYSLNRRIDALRELIDEQILKESVDLHNSWKAKRFFDEILPRTENLTDLWFCAANFNVITNIGTKIGTGFDPTEPKTKDAQETKETASELESEDHEAESATVWIDTIDSLITWAVEGTEVFKEDGGAGDSEIVVTNEAFQRAMRLINAKFFNPDVWYDNLLRINPIIANPKKIPRDVRYRVGEIHSSLIIGNYLSSVILCRSVLEFF